MAGAIKKRIYDAIAWLVQILFKAFFLFDGECENRELHHILVIRLDEIGDVVLTTPFLRELRNNYPTSRITLLVKPVIYNLVEFCPYVDDVLVFSKPTGRGFDFKIILAALQFARQHLWRARYDIAIVPRWDTDTGYGAGWIAFFSRAVRRIGYSEHVYVGKEVSDRGFDRLYTDVIVRREIKHEVERNLDILRYLGGKIESAHLEVWTGPKDKKYASQWFDTYLPERNKPIVIALFLSAGSKQKEWGVGNYAAVLKRLRGRYPLHVVLLGDRKNTEQYGTRFLQEYGEGGVSNLIGKTSLRETIEILKGCDLYFGGDTGPMHLAAACKMLGVALFFMPKGVGKTIGGIFPPERFGPWDSNLVILQPDAFGDGKGDNNFEQPSSSISLEGVQASLEAIFEKVIKESLT